MITIYLHGQLVASMAAAVDDVEAGDRHEDVLDPSEVSDVSVERDTLVGSPGLADGHGHAEDGVGAQLGLVLCPVQGQHQAIDLLLLNRVHALGDNLWSDQVVDIVDSLHDTLAVPGVGLVPQLQSLVDAGAGTGGNGGPEDSSLSGEVDLDGGITAGVIDLTSVDPLDGHF